MLSTLLALVETEGPAFIGFLIKIIPDLKAFFTGQLQRDALFVSLDAAIDAHRATVRAEIHAKYSEPT